MQHNMTTASVSTSIRTPHSFRPARPLPAEVEMLEVKLDGLNPPGSKAALVEIIDQRAAGIRVRQGARTTEWLPTSQLMVEVGPLAAMHDQVRLYIPTWLIEKTGLSPLGAAQVERDRLALEAHRARWEERRALVDVLYERQADRELDEPRTQFDEAFASYSFESREQLEQRDLDGARYSVIALDPAAEESAAGRAQIYAYSVIEHFQELMHDVVLGHERYVTVVRECKHWMAQLDADTTMEPEIKDAVMRVLIRVRHAANEARREAPRSLAAQQQRRAWEQRALRALERAKRRLA
jgi:hypothetical protein